MSNAVTISYKNSTIATMNATGVKTLLTGATFCEDDIVVSYTAPSGPSGTKNISISASGTITEDVTNYANVEVAVPQGSAGTPTAVKGSVSNHSITVTPSVTNTTGFITGGTKSGTAATVSASELVSGTLSITENGTGIDVTNYANVDVNVSGGGSASHTVTVSLSNPYHGSEFSGCILKDGGENGTQIGTISSPTGSKTVTVTTGVLYIEVASESGWVEFNVDNLLSIGTPGSIGLSDYHHSSSEAYAIFVVVGDGSILLDFIDYDA